MCEIGDSELLVFQAESREALLETCRRLSGYLINFPSRLVDVAYTVNCLSPDQGKCRLAIVADSLSDLERKLDLAITRLGDSRITRIGDRDGVYFFEKPLGGDSKLAFLFPGEGAQYPDMLSDLCVRFAEARASFDLADHIFDMYERRPSLSQVVFPPTGVPSEVLKRAKEMIWSMEYAVMAVYAAELAFLGMLRELAIVPQVMVGHSVGQDFALWASGSMFDFSEEQFMDYALKTRILFPSVEKQMPKIKLMAVGALEYAIISDVVDASNGKLVVSMDNCPNQVVVCGGEEDVQQAYHRFIDQGAVCSFLPFGRAYHTPWYGSASTYLSEKVSKLKIRPPQTEVYCCGSAMPFPDDPDEIRHITASQWAQPVRFHETIEAMYENGTVIFLEVGPRGNLISFVEDILGQGRYAAVPLNITGCGAVTQFNQAIGLLAAHGISMNLEYLYTGRKVEKLPIIHRSGIALEEVEIGSSQKKKDDIGRLNLALPGFKLANKVPVIGHEKTSSNTNLNIGSDAMSYTDGKDPAPTVEAMQRFSPTGHADSDTAKAPAGFAASETDTNSVQRFFASRKSIVSWSCDPNTGSGIRGGVTEQNLTRFPWLLPPRQFHKSERVFCCLCVENGGEFDSYWLANRILGRKEFEIWRVLQGGERRKRRWLRGRLAAKDAVYLLSKNLFQMEVRHSDIAILSDQYGKPRLFENRTEKVGSRLSVSIAHTEMASVGIAAEVGGWQQSIGIDLERMDRNHEGLEHGGFLRHELALLNHVVGGQRKEWLLRLWCAKEAVSKALGQGMRGSPFNLVVLDIDFESGQAVLKKKGASSVTSSSNMAYTKMPAYTGRQGDLVFATSVF